MVLGYVVFFYGAEGTYTHVQGYPCDFYALGFQLSHQFLCKMQPCRRRGYAAAMGGVDAVVFTAGVGENDANVRGRVCGYLGFMGVKIDEAKNATRGQAIDLSTTDAKVRALAIPTNEELVIARDTKEALK